MLFPTAAYADAGIPMLPFAYPVILLLLLPVIAIEVAYIRFRLGTNWRSTVISVSKANIITLLLGFPLAWLLFFLVESVLWMIFAFSGLEDRIHWPLNSQTADVLIVMASAAWMGPIEKKWAIPTAFVVLLIPSFVLSGYVESRLLERRGWLSFQGKSAAVVWQANIISYIFLAIVGVLALAEYLSHR
jgi:hypothetical protein